MKEEDKKFKLSDLCCDCHKCLEGFHYFIKVIYFFIFLAIFYMCYSTVKHLYEFFKDPFR